MFNQVGFNDHPFNRSYKKEVLISSTLIAQSFISGKAVRNIEYESEISGESIVLSEITRVVLSDSDLDSIGDLSANIVRGIGFKNNLEAESNLIGVLKRDIKGNSTISAEAKVIAKENIIGVAAVSAQSESTVFATLTNVIQFKSEIKSKSFIQGNINRIIFNKSELKAESNIQANARRYKTESIIYEDSFLPGIGIVIDAEKAKITESGKVINHLFSGDFFNLQIGVNQIEYVDDTTTRDVKIRVEYRDRYI